MTFETCMGLVRSGTLLTQEQAEIVANYILGANAEERLQIWLLVQKVPQNVFKVEPHIRSIYTEKR